MKCVLSIKDANNINHINPNTYNVNIFFIFVLFQAVCCSPHLYQSRLVSTGYPSFHHQSRRFCQYDVALVYRCVNYFTYHQNIWKIVKVLPSLFSSNGRDFRVYLLYIYFGLTLNKLTTRSPITAGLLHHTSDGFCSSSQYSKVLS